MSFLSNVKKPHNGQGILANYTSTLNKQDTRFKSCGHTCRVSAVHFKDVVKFNKAAKFWAKKRTCGVPVGKRCGGILQSCPPRRACPPPGPPQTICCPSPHACCTSPCQFKPCNPNICQPKC